MVNSHYTTASKHEWYFKRGRKNYLQAIIYTFFLHIQQYRNFKIINIYLRAANLSEIKQSLGLSHSYKCPICKKISLVNVIIARDFKKSHSTLKFCI